MITHAQRTQVRLLFADGAHPEQIAARLGVDVRDVVNALPSGISGELTPGRPRSAAAYVAAKGRQGAGAYRQGKTVFGRGRSRG